MNWLTTSIAPPTSASERFILPASSSKIRKPTIFSARNSTSAGPSRSVDGGALSDELAEALRRCLEPTSENPEHPTFAGAVALVTIGGQRMAGAAVGEALRYGAGPVLLPPEQRVPMREDSIFDLASVTKVYTAILLLRLVDEGRVDLTAPTVTGLPDPSCRIWPPNGRMVTIADVVGDDALSGVAAVSADVTVDEPAANDYVVDGGVVRVRATRDDEGDGRVYTVTGGVTDVAGNQSTAVGSCLVPHDRRP